MRRDEEWAALRAIFDSELEGSAAGPWRIQLGHGAALEVHPPDDYPSREPPAPIILAPMLSEARLAELADELLAMHDGDEVVFQWAERCREVVEEEATAVAVQRAASTADLEFALQHALELSPDEPTPDDAAEAAEAADAEHRVEIFAGQPLHPPKSGPGETFCAHAARVTSAAQVSWVLAELLRDKRIRQATHNMLAYRFWDAARAVQVADSDDDGESSSGAKLAALLELTGSQDVLVVVSRWYGGIHLGPARFKHIATAGRDALVAAGLVGRGPGGGMGSGGGGGPPRVPIRQVPRVPGSEASSASSRSVRDSLQAPSNREAQLAKDKAGWANARQAKAAKDRAQNAARTDRQETQEKEKNHRLNRTAAAEREAVGVRARAERDLACRDMARRRKEKERARADK